MKSNQKSGALLKSLLRTNEGAPLMIGGPCSAETKEQVLETARRLKALGQVQVFRSGIWKPRTRPNSFEGVGKEGLGWLQQVKELTGMPVAIEVANVRHVAEALEYGIDILWLGARTSVNPFSVQEIADALAGTNVSVMVKNPINPDLGLWIGAIERLAKAGITDLGVIHRGFSTDNKMAYRNAPKWKIAMDFRNEMPEIPMVCDPSHIGGRRDVLQEISQKALDLGMDGLMVESHISPDEAWSDAKQQITPEAFGALISSLDRKKNGIFGAGLKNSRLLGHDQHLQDELRDEMDSLDHELLDLLSHRAQVSGKLGAIALQDPLQGSQNERDMELMNRLVKKAKAEGLEESFIQSIFAVLNEHSLKGQEA